MVRGFTGVASSSAIWGALAALVALALAGGAAGAASYEVTTEADSGPGSLRQAIADANASPGADEITFSQAVSTITLASTLPEVTDPAGLTIDGGGDVTVSGDDQVRVLIVSFGARLELEGLTVADGNFAGSGGGILNLATLDVTGSTVAGNSAVDGGGIHNFPTGTLTVSGSTISDNSTFGRGSALGSGGGLYNEGTLTVVGSTISGNSAFYGGGIQNSSTLEVTRSTLSANSARSYGGGVNNDGTATVTNSTTSGNSAAVGGGIRNTSNGGSSPGILTVSNSTISGNSASEEGGGIQNDGAATLRATIVADSPSGVNCGGGGNVSDGLYNVSDDDSCIFGPGSLNETDPLLGPLADNGGPTRTQALLEGSPAVDLVEAGCPPPETDQRGVSRPQDGDGEGEALCDSGAFEVRAQAPPPPPPGPAECTIEGTRRSDVLTGTERDDVICGFGGSDIITGAGGRDVLRGGAGDDAVTGGSGPDDLFGGSGADALNSRDGVRGNDSVDGGAGNDDCTTDRRDTRRSC